MMKLQRKFFTWALLAFALIWMASASRGGTSDHARSKARYYFSSAVVAEAEGHSDAAYEYYKRAYQFDPSYAEAAIGLGSSTLALDNSALQNLDFQVDAMTLMRKYVEKYPEDLYESLYYAYVANNLGDDDEAIRVIERAYALHPDYSLALVQLSDLYARRNELPKAIESLSKYERQEGMSEQVTSLKLSYMLANRDTVGALRETDRLIATSPTDVDALLLKGTLMEMIQKADSAKIYYDLAEALEPDASAPKLALAAFYHQRGDSAAYDDKMYEVLLTEDLDMDTKSELTAEYLQNLISNNQDTRRGDHLFSVLREQAPHEPRVLDLAARYSAAKQDFPAAIENISYAIDRDPTNQTFWTQLLTYYAAADSLDKCMAAYQRACEHITPDRPMKLYFASAAQLAKRYDLASDTYRSMILEITPGVNPDSAQTLDVLPRNVSLQDLDMLSSLYQMLGDIHNLSGNKAQSYIDFENALVFNSSNKMAANNYAYFLALDGGNLDRAFELSHKAIEGDGAQNPTYIDTFAWITFLKGNPAAALPYQLKAVETMEKEGSLSADVYCHLGDIQAALENYTAALEAWQKGVDLMQKEADTDNPDYKATLKKIAETSAKIPSSKPTHE